MSAGKANRKISLRRKIFYYLLWTTFFAMMLIGAFWIGNAISDFKKDAGFLKESYSENKKSEIKRNILEIKDWIYSVRNHPSEIVSGRLTHQLESIRAGLNKKKIIQGDIIRQFTDSTCSIGIPFVIYNKQEGVISYQSSKPGLNDRDALKYRTTLLNFLKKNYKEGEHPIPVNSETNSSDSVNKTIIYCNTTIFPGYAFAAVISHEFSEKVLQEYCIDSLSRIRFSSDEYIFINTYDGKALSSNGQINNPPVEILKSGDTAWIRIFRVERLAESKYGGLFYTYNFRKISSPKSSIKTSFFSYLPEWKWIIGTGFYEDDIYALIEQKKETLIADLRRSLLYFAPLLLISVLLSYFMVLFFSKRLSNNIEIFKNFFTRAVGERAFIDKSQVSYKEFEILAETANSMVEEGIKADTALRLSEERYRLLFERNPASMLIYERLTYKILAVNVAFQNHYGYSGEELLSMRLPDLYPVDEKLAITEFAENLHGHVHTGEWHHIRKDGSVIIILASSHDLIYKDRECRIAVVTDITERKLAEEKIEVSEKQLSLIYSNVFDAVYYLSVEPENRFRFISINNTFLNLTGLSENQIVNKDVDEIIPEPSLSFVKRNYRKAIEERMTVQWEEITEYPTGKKTGMVSITPLFDSYGKCINLVGTVHDITERKRVEEELKIHRDNLQELVVQRTAELEKEKEHAQSSDRLKSAFLATMSHELRTPLNSIIGFTGILLREHPGPLNEEQKKQLGMAQNSARHLLSLINDVLDISKIEAGELKMNFQQFNLPDVINKVVETNKPFADRKNLRMEVSIDERIGLIVSDDLRVRQILLNLVNNAIKFTESGTVSINCTSSEDAIIIKVTDTGSGIECSKIEQLFRPFIQIDTGLTRKHEGTGLGLSICKKLAELLHGKIEVESEYGSGSTFTVTLPLNYNQ